MDLFAAIKGRRSCRNFLSEPISEDTIEKILEAATWAPSPLNSQPWEFIVITNQEVKEKIFAEADMFMEEGSVGYQAACAAAIQNMHLAAHSLGLGSLWFTLFDKKAMKEILGIFPEKTPLAMICLGKAGSPPPLTPRKDLKEKITYIR